MIALLLLLVPAIQLGFSYYASAATAMALLVTARTLGVLPNTSSITWIAVSATAAAMFLSALFIPGVTEADLWRRAREAFFFFWMIPALSVIAIRPVTISNKIVFAILAVVILFAGIALIQASALAGGRYFGLPSEYFIQNAATLPGLLDLKYSRIRPTGTFGEPSYFAFILISMLVMLIPLVRKTVVHIARQKTVANAGLALTTAHWAACVGALLIVIAGVLSQSFSFYLAAPVLLCLGVVRYASAKARLWIAGLGIAVLIFFLGTYVSDVVLDRVSRGSEDTSFAGRILIPARVLPEYLFRYPVGVPDSTLVVSISELTSRYGLRVNSVTDNALILLIFKYGFIGLMALTLYFRSTRSLFMALYLFLCLMFNGAIFAVDKYSVIVLTVLIYFGLNQNNEFGQTSVRLRRLINWRRRPVPAVMQ